MSDWQSTSPPTWQQGPGAAGPPAATARGASGPRAGFWRRFGASFLDGIIVGIVQGALAAAIKGGVGAALGVLVSFAYYTILEGGPRGQTLGKMALGIRVIDFGGGGPIGYARGFLRQIVKIVSGAVILLGYLWMLWDREKQTWHDKAANDVVVPVSAYPVPAG